MDTKLQSNKLMDIFLDLGEMLLTSGAEINRIEDTLSRLCYAYGAKKSSVFVITSSIVITLLFDDDIEVTQTRKIHSSRGSDFERLNLINSLSRKCTVNPLPVDELEKEVNIIKNKKISVFKDLIGSVIAGFGFPIFFGGNIFDGIAGAFFGFLIFLIRRYIAPISPNKVFYNFICSFLIGLGICLLCLYIPTLHSDKIMIGDIMLLIPGIAITNAIKDILIGDTISGSINLIESLVRAGALAGGFMLAMTLVSHI